jgi:hypothetical protein
VALIDTDSHFEPADWLDQFPHPQVETAGRFPTDDPRFTMCSPEIFAWFVTDHLRRSRTFLFPSEPTGSTPTGLLAAPPEVPVFSSDYPYFEGNNDPVGHYDKELCAVPASAKQSFLGDNLAQCFARMNDPIVR